MDPENVEHRLAAILSADVVGYSRLMAADEESTVRTLRAYRDEIGLLVAQHRGRVVDFPGDNLLAEFPTAIDAVRGAVAIQRVLDARNAGLPEDRRMIFRVGVHLGDVRIEGNRIYGDGVNIAARLEGLADPGGICISATVHEQVRNKLEVGYTDLGDQAVKNIPEQVHVFAVELGGATAAAEPARAGAPAGLLWALALVGVLGAGGALLWLLPSAPGLGPGPTDEAPVLVVLPFENMSGDAEQEYFADGLTEDLITDLSKISGLMVIARNSSFTYKGQAVRVQDVGHELGVGYVLEGSVRKAGDRVRITAQLVETENGHHLWAERYDRQIADIFALQDEVTRQIVAALEVHLSDEEQIEIDRIPTRNMEAYDLYQRALVYLGTGQRSPEAHAQAAALLERVIELDPEFGPAHGALAGAIIGAYMSHAYEGADPLSRAEQLADRALELDDTSVISLETAAGVYSRRGRHPEALAAARRAVELHPNSARAHGALGTVAPDFEEALRELRFASRLDPFDPVLAFNYGGRLLFVRSYDEAVEVLKRGISKSPDFIGLHGMLAVVYAEMGRVEDARAEGAEVLRINPEFSLEALIERNVADLPEDLRQRIIDGVKIAGLR